MTNREKINEMSDEELITFIKAMRSDELFPFYDMKKWLETEDAEPEVIGMDAFYLRGASEIEKITARNEGREPAISREPCRIIGKTSFFGKPYYTSVPAGQKTYMKVPGELVEEMH